MQFSQNALVYGLYNKLIYQKLITDNDMVKLDDCYQEENSVFLKLPKGSIKLNEDASIQKL